MDWIDAARTLSLTMRISRLNCSFRVPVQAPPNGSMPMSDGLLRKKYTVMDMAMPQPIPKVQKATLQS